MLSMVPAALIEAVLSVWRMVVSRPEPGARGIPLELGRVSLHPLTTLQSSRGHGPGLPRGATLHLEAGQLPVVGPLR